MQIFEFDPAGVLHRVINPVGGFDKIEIRGTKDVLNVGLRVSID